MDCLNCKRIPRFGISQQNEQEARGKLEADWRGVFLLTNARSPFLRNAVSRREGSASFNPRFSIMDAGGSGAVRERVRDVVRQVRAEMGVIIIKGLLSRDHVHMFVEIPPHIAVSHFVQKAKGRSSRKIQQEFPEIRRHY